MAKADLILDGLAWAGIKEPARVAKIAAKIVREISADNLTKADVKRYVRDTSPPYGRAKHVFAALWGTGPKPIICPECGKKNTPVRNTCRSWGCRAELPEPPEDPDYDEGEIARQRLVYLERKKRHDAWKTYQNWRAKRATRLNRAYAGAFDRPIYEPERQNPHQLNWDYDSEDYKLYQEWEQKERERDKGDKCLGLTHQGKHVVCLVISQNMSNYPHIATRHKKGGIVRTYLRGRPDNLVEALVSLGGPKVRSALTQGKKVVPDWVGRRIFIHHEGQDHQNRHIEEIPWRAQMFEWGPIYGRMLRNFPYPIIIHGDRASRDRVPNHDEYNDCD